LGKVLHRLSRQGSANFSKRQQISANISKCQQMSANVSNCQQVSENVSIHVDFVLEKIFLVSNCQQLSANVSRFVFSSASVSKMMMTPAYPIKHQPDIERTRFSPPASAYLCVNHD
jgi:hypothetical protein